jgi:hypothetical protein
MVLIGRTLHPAGGPSPYRKEVGRASPRRGGGCAEQGRQEDAGALVKTIDQFRAQTAKLDQAAAPRWRFGRK